MTTAPRITAWQPLDNAYLIDLGDGTGILADLAAGVRWHPRYLGSLTKHGYWHNHADDPKLRAKLMALPLHPRSRPWVPSELG